MDRKKLRVGVFGGARGRVMVNLLLDHPDAELVAVCDKYEPLLARARETAEKAGMKIAVFTSFDDFIRYDMDAVVLANYANEHATYAIRCLEAGKHVLSECLPCETMAQAVALIEAVERTGLVYAYAENVCYFPAPFEMWRRYRAGEIGTFTYGEGEYVHDCSSIWPSIIYGERDHWRNRMHANFYCTHSDGPLFTITGLRPVKVTGFELPPSEQMKELGSWHGVGIEMITLENGAMYKSIHGGLKREPSSHNVMIYGTKGMMESGRLSPLSTFNIYKEGPETCKGAWEHYEPKPFVAPDIPRTTSTHSGSDFYPMHCWIEKILGKEDGKWSIDVYTGVEMGICGILAYRSVLAGGVPVTVPDLRDPAQRDAFRNDNACTTPEVAGDQLLPGSSFPKPEIPDEAYDRVRAVWTESTKH